MDNKATRRANYNLLLDWIEWLGTRIETEYFFIDNIGEFIDRIVGYVQTAVPLTGDNLKELMGIGRRIKLNKKELLQEAC